MTSFLVQIEPLRNLRTTPDITEWPPSRVDEDSPEVETSISSSDHCTDSVKAPDASACHQRTPLWALSASGHWSPSVRLTLCREHRRPD